MRRSCVGCSKIDSCGKIRKIIFTHEMKLCSHSSIGCAGFAELYGKTTASKVLKAMDRLRKVNGYLYIFKGVGANAYMKKEDLPKNIFSSFALNPITGFYEFDLSESVLLSA